MENKIYDILVSVIIVSYNNFHLLKNCLESLYNYTACISFEVIIIDNNSTEGDVETIVNCFPRITLIKNNSNRGFAAANNQGIAVARGKYILFLNNDTIFFENSIKKVFDFADTNESPVIIGCKLLNKDSSLQLSVYDFPSLRNVITSNFFLYLLFPKSNYFNKYHLMNRKISNVTEVDVVTGAFLFGTKEFLNKIGGFDERFFFYNEETDLCLRFKKLGGKIYYFPESAIIHLKGGTANDNFEQRYKNEHYSTIKYYQRHFSGGKFLFIIISHYLGMIIRVPIFLFWGIFKKDKILIFKSLSNFKNMFLYPKNIFRKK